MTRVDASASLAGARGSQGAIVRILFGAAIVELLLFVWLVAAGRETFLNFVWTPDTASYIGVAEQLAERHTLAASPRTLGYPLFAAAGYYLGGETSGPYIVIAVQLLLNLVLVWLGWRLLERTAPDVTVSLRAAATLFLFWAGMGMAVFLMTDLLAAVSFAIFLYGFLFWRDSWRALVAAAALACATLTRPTFTFVPLLLPAAAYLVRHVTYRIPAAHVLVFGAFSLVATSASLAYQYTFNQYLGPSPLLSIPIQEMLYYGTVKGRSSTDLETFKSQFEREVEKRTGRQISALTSGEREEAAKEIFREQYAVYPLEITANVLKNAVKYVFAPVESTVMRFAGMSAGASWYTNTLRPLVALVCLPILVLSLVPPVGGPRSRRVYYLLMLAWLIYIIGFSAISTGSGERIRFPLLAFMLPVFVWNADTLRRRWVVARLARQPIVAGGTGDGVGPG